MQQYESSLADPQTVLVIDSGIGGISIVQALQTRMPWVRIIYVADNALFPYGEKPQRLIMQRLQQIIDVTLLNYAIDTIVIGCNTATVMHIDQLRQHYSHQNVPFVGVVPPVKTAAETSQSRCFTIVATQNTSQSLYLEGLIRDYASTCEVTTVAAVGLADYVEKIIHGIAVEEDQLQEILSSMLNQLPAHADALVLGCTHYAFIQAEIATLLPDHINIIEPSIPVAKRVQWLLQRHSKPRKHRLSNQHHKMIQRNRINDDHNNQFFFTQAQEISASFTRFLQAHKFKTTQVLSLNA